MITFARGTTNGNNTVEINFGTEVHYVSPEAPVKGKSGDSLVYVGDKLKLGNSGNYFKLKTTDINGRPSDDAAAVAEWLRDTYFFGIASATAGGSFPNDYSNSGNQVLAIGELQDINAEVAAANTKSGSSQVTVLYDHRSFNYNGDDSLNYISYKTGGISGTEVARLTYTYDGNGNVTEITKT